MLRRTRNQNRGNPTTGGWPSPLTAYPRGLLTPVDERSRPKAAPQIQAAARTKASVPDRPRPQLRLSRDPHAAARDLAEQLGGTVLAWRWAKALIAALS